MIITKLCGGLGNQMFQYAAGRSLAFKLGTDLKLDLACYSSSMSRSYSLSHLKIIESFATESEIQKLKYRALSYGEKILPKLRLRSHAPSQAFSYVKEKHFHFDPAILALKGDIYLEGYWQSEKYFCDIMKIIREDFSLKLPLSSESLKLYDTIHSHESISIHIRRGDYVTNPSTNQYHGTCSLNYYNLSIRYLVDFVRNPYFIVFSDDPDWCQQNLKIPFQTTIINHKGQDLSHEDIYLMSLCKHHIIANSSFSWWGAWLNPKSDKIIICPTKWFAQKNLNTQDLIPQNWIRM